MSSKNQKTGAEGEQIARMYLISLGHQILETNWRAEQFEVDIISKINNVIVFTEVKTRTSSQFGKPEDAVTTAKQKYLGKAADEYIYLKKYDGDIRFDIISIELKKKKNEQPEIMHHEDAFFPIG